MKIIYHEYIDQNKNDLTLLLPTKVNFKARIARDRRTCHENKRVNLPKR